MSNCETCDNYLGMTCIIGGCPILTAAVDNKYQRHCKNCVLNEGCGDCYFATETGCRLKKSTISVGKNPTATESCNSECVKYKIIKDPNGLPINLRLFRLLSRYSGDPRGAEGLPGDITYMI